MSTKKSGARTVHNVQRAPAKTKTKRESSTESPKTKTEDDKMTKRRTTIRKADEEKTLTTIRDVSRGSKRISKTEKSRPTTPPSSRVTKTKYFPSKTIYKNALTSQTGAERKAKPPGAANKRVSSKTETKSPKTNTAPSELAAASERPRTATLKRGSIVNNNIVGPDIPIEKLKSLAADSSVYEDDFDSYESDFDEYNSSDSPTNLNVSEISEDSSSTESTSPRELKSAQKRVSSAGTDDERKLDSGNYELPEYKHKQILDNIKESIEKENTALNLASLSDEGFEDGKSLQFLNFLGAQRKCQHRKSIQKMLKRGEEILSMIKLDTFSFTLLDFPPVPYDVFIKTFGTSNTVQTSTQTGDDSIEEEVQTETICKTNKWTQFPIMIPRIEVPNLYEMYKSNYLGVGGDELIEPTEFHVNQTSLEKFMRNAGNLILNLQYDSNLIDEDSSRRKTTNLPFSKGYILFDTRKQEFLTNRPINRIYFDPSNNKKFLTVHERKDLQGFVCLWSIVNNEAPEMVLVAFGNVTCCCIRQDTPNLVFGGLQDGTIVIWDIKHPLKTDENFYTSNYSSEVRKGHLTKIVAIHPLISTSSVSTIFESNQATEICSLDEEGELIIWSVIIKNQNQSRWDTVVLAINSRISLAKLHPDLSGLQCTDFVVNHLDANHLFISTNYGFILHCLANGVRTGVKRLFPDNPSQANCLEPCPFSPIYIVAGFDDGSINFYSHSIERPLMVMSNKDNETCKCKIQLVQWSQNRPMIIYTKDIANFVHIWDLDASDIFPICSIPFKEEIVGMKLSPSSSEENYMMIATSSGLIYFYLLNSDHGRQSLKSYQDEKRQFLNCINRNV